MADMKIGFLPAFSACSQYSVASPNDTRQTLILKDSITPKYDSSLFFNGTRDGEREPIRLIAALDYHTTDLL